MNGAIHELKAIAKGFSKVDSFRTSILFYYGKLHLMPTQKTSRTEITIRVRLSSSNSIQQKITSALYS